MIYTKKGVNIIGAGLSGLLAAMTLAERGIECAVYSSQPSERAQSVLAEGGINAALDTMGEKDSPEEHYNDTMKGGCYIASEDAVKGLTDNAPDMVKKLCRLGVPFNRDKGRLLLRNFGGQKKKRTAFAKSSTGKIIMTALIDEVRKYENKGLVKRYPHHELIDMTTINGRLESFAVRDSFSGEVFSVTGSTILCTGGLNGFFEGVTTGTTQNTGNAAAIAFDAGVLMSGLEFIQYHPTTIGICGKRMLISEAARGEGGRLYILRDGKPWYFMEDKYPELKNLMPRDVVSREMFFASREYGGEIFLDMTGIKDTIWEKRLSDLREEIISYIHIDPRITPVPVSPGIHFFMGGIYTDNRHKTNIDGLYAAGEAACIYHGANRLGGNSMLGAVYGGMTAALSAAETAGEIRQSKPDGNACNDHMFGSSVMIREQLRDILLSGLGIVRNENELLQSLDKLSLLEKEKNIGATDQKRIRLGKAMILSALKRKESRGAHYRMDFPETSDKYRKQSVALYHNEKIEIDFCHPGDALKEVQK